MKCRGELAGVERCDVVRGTWNAQARKDGRVGLWDAKIGGTNGSC
jgi:hypothetical protein